MRQSDLKQFKFDGKICTGFYCLLDDKDVIFTRNILQEFKEDYLQGSRYGNIWTIQVLDMPNLLPIQFETPKENLSLVKTAEIGISCLLGQIRSAQTNLESLAIEINKQIMVVDKNGK